MERTEAFDTAGLSRLQVRLRWASAAVLCSNVEQFEVVVSGSGCDKQISELSVKAENGRLSIEQPTALPDIKGARPAMQVRVFIPTSWKGEISAETRSGMLEAVGLRGTDVALNTVSGALEAASIEAISLKAGSGSGTAHISGASCDQLQLSSLSGTVNAEDCDFRTARFHSTSGCCMLHATGTFDSIGATTASGDFHLTIPFDAADVSFRATSGRLRTNGVDLMQGAPDVRMNTLSGNLLITKQDHPQQEDDMI